MGNCLAVYDITGVQEFIFASNKAKENIGGSIYVRNIFEDGLVECINSLGEKNVDTGWKNTKNAVLGGLKALVVYIGGGNAMVLFDEKKTAVSVTKKLAKKILEDTQATLGIAVAYQETDLINFKEDKEKLFKTLNKNKNSMVRSTPLRGIAITRECADGLPAGGKQSEDKVYISNIAHKKRELVKTSEVFSDLLPEKCEYQFPVEFDDLGQKEGESHIAVVHIDGNSMGRFIDSKLNDHTDYNQAVTVMRNISAGLQELYSTVFKEMVEMCIESIKKEDVKKRIKLKDKVLPVRPIILNGDDVTFVCDGRIGIQLAGFFLEKLAEKDLEIGEAKEKISACAGIAIVKSHFPFFRAYELAEALCRSAKKKGKHFNNNTPGCWMDYHIVYSGFQADLDSMRKRLYNIPGMAAACRDVTNGFSQSNLLLRPYCVSGISDDMYKWQNMKNLYSEMTKIPRSRLKDLRNSFISSEANVKLCQEQNSSRNHKLPDYNMRDGVAPCNNNSLFAENQTPYFEPLELLDFYLPEFEKGVKS